MQLFRDLDVRGRFVQGSVATIGNFDGIHLGHQALLDTVRENARARDLAGVVVTFDPLAREYFAPDAAPGRIYNTSQRLRHLARERLTATWLMRFNRTLADLTPGAFVELLRRGINPQIIVVGQGFRFGRDRAGDIETLTAGGEVQVIAVPPVLLGDERVSSTRIRQVLAAGDLKGAERLLGRPFNMYGRVVRGQALGRTLGFPTANIRLHRRATPISGIFAVRVTGAGLTQWPGVASIGTRPTVGGKETLLEVFLFDFSADLYGNHLEVEFVARLRDEEKFDSLDAMTVQMLKDAERARALLDENQQEKT
ncbi:MAG: bifunctional riboflavin kinase/FAD synthetase [Pseudomonadota bacterium]